MLYGCSLMGNDIIVLCFDLHEELTQIRVFSKDLWDVT